MGYGWECWANLWRCYCSRRCFLWMDLLLLIDLGGPAGTGGAEGLVHLHTHCTTLRECQLSVEVEEIIVLQGEELALGGNKPLEQVRMLAQA